MVKTNKYMKSKINITIITRIYLEAIEYKDKSIL